MAPPVPIPNTEVKRAFADGSASLGCARVGRCQYHEPRGRKLLRGSFFIFPVRHPEHVEGSLTILSFAGRGSWSKSSRDRHVCETDRSLPGLHHLFGSNP